VHSYPVKSNGAIGKEVSTINTQNYDGADCDTGVGTAGAVLDHTGQDVYVLLDNYWYEGSIQLCAAYQAYSISKSSGALEFNGTAEPASVAESAGIPTFTGNNVFAYASGSDVRFTPGLIAFSRKSDGTPQALSFNEIDPNGYSAFFAAADPTNHLAVVVAAEDDESYGAARLASYSVDVKGNIASTNTVKSMPYPHVNPTTLSMSPSGRLLAVGGNGLQVFHFNGASPITHYSGMLLTTPVSQINWDHNNHLYVLSDSTNKLYVYTVTPTTITAAPGSPYTISGPNALVVVPKL
jgi:hypothetical protein